MKPYKVLFYKVNQTLKNLAEGIILNSRIVLNWRIILNIPDHDRYYGFYNHEHIISQLHNDRMDSTPLTTELVSWRRTSLCLSQHRKLVVVVELHASIIPILWLSVVSGR